MTNIAITGAAGRMGQRLIAVARQSDDLKIVAAIERGGSEFLGRDAGEVSGIGPIGLRISEELEQKPDVLIDFTVPAGMKHWLKACRDRGIGMVIGTTGLTPDDHEAIDVAAEKIAVLQAGNMSLGVTVMCRIVEEVAKLLGPDYDAEILEAHHRYKKDAPSGTAEMIAAAVLKGLNRDQTSLVYGRHGGEVTRQAKDVTMHSLRMGDEVGLHTAYFGGLGERLEITHKATSRDTFVHGALRAARWIAQQQPGRYRIDQMF
ncbi:MAG TPA: 4-hydroxy-tetrahydrodipicolinate reductase [Tepidisphaeraceae bacterium]|jgi:4-hydroxy-tetrahydrodipicolinate reductase